MSFSHIQILVLIESDWNLKEAAMEIPCSVPHVLIESDWNLKTFVGIMIPRFVSVLIESDWNLKIRSRRLPCHAIIGINRSRLEFKVHI